MAWYFSFKDMKKRNYHHGLGHLNFFHSGNIAFSGYIKWSFFIMSFLLSFLAIIHFFSSFLINFYCIKDDFPEAWVEEGDLQVPSISCSGPAV